MKTKISSTKKILAASVALLASLGVAASSTFAWFTTNSTVTVDAYQTTIVSGSDSLTMAIADTYLSVTTEGESVTATETPIDSDFITGTQFKTALTSTDFARVRNYNTARLAALTSATGYTFANSAGGTAAAHPELANVAVTGDTTQGGYVTFKLVFRNRAASENSNLYLKSGSIAPTNATAPVVTYNPTQFSTIATNVGYDLTETGAANTAPAFYGTSTAARILRDTTELSTRGAYAARVSLSDDNDNNTQTKVKNWAPNELYTNGSNGSGSVAAGTPNTFTNADGSTVDADGNTLTAPGYYLNNLANDYAQNVLGNTNVSALGQPALANPVVASDTNGVGNFVATFARIGTDTLYNYAVVTVRIWIEGSDGDCFDVVLADAFSTTMVFGVGTHTAG